MTKAADPPGRHPLGDGGWSWRGGGGFRVLYYLADGHIVAVVVPENTEVKKMEKFLFKFIAFCD